MIQILNVVWLVVAFGTCVAALPRRHDRRAAVALIAFAALMFPIISASDDLAADQTIVDAFAAILVGFAFFLGLTLVSRIAAESRQFRALAVPVYSDPRSPPRV